MGIKLFFLTKLTNHAKTGKIKSGTISVTGEGRGYIGFGQYHNVTENFVDLVLPDGYVYTVY